MAVPKPTLLIACGALAKEITHLIEANGWQAFELACLPAKLHNYPQRIPGAMKAKITEAKESGKFAGIIALYGDCGTGGELDRVLADEGVARIDGAHCYEFYAGTPAFEAMVEEELGTFYLTDYLVRFFDRLIIEGLGIDRHPQLLDDYFGHYKRLVYLSQVDDPKLVDAAKRAAERIGLEFEHRPTGYGDLEGFMKRRAEETSEWRN